MQNIFYLLRALILVISLFNTLSNELKHIIMRIISVLMGRGVPQEPVPYQEILPLRLRARVSGKGDNKSDVCCIYEMSVMFACFKEHNFEQSLCAKEIENFQKCYHSHLTEKQIKKEREAKGVLVPGEKNLSHKQLNRLFKNFASK
ncbi:hypothetical protein Trydic_g9374 [Trypoxylus dichotomus]